VRVGRIDIREQDDVRCALKTDTRMALSSSSSRFYETTYEKEGRLGAEMSALHNPGIY